MTEKKTYKPSNYRIISIRQQRRMLHVEDALDIGKIRFDLYAFTQGKGSHAHADAYIDLHTARLIFAELADGALNLTNRLRIQGGGTSNGNRTRSGTVSRFLTFELADDTKNPIRIDITNGPGLRRANGLITPDNWEKNKAQVTRLNMLLSLSDATQIGLAGLEHMQAWAANTYIDRLATESFHPRSQSDFPAEDLDPLTGEIVKTLTGDQMGEGLNPTAGRPEPSDPQLRYVNGDPVSDNPNEIAYFQSYVKAEKRMPPDVESLRQWVKNTPQARK